MPCRPVVILANRPKLEMDAECSQGLAGMGLDVDTRCGVPFSVTDLEKVAAGTARTVLLLSNDHVSVVSIIRMSLHNPHDRESLSEHDMMQQMICRSLELLAHRPQPDTICMRHVKPVMSNTNWPPFCSRRLQHTATPRL